MAHGYENARDQTKLFAVKIFFVFSFRTTASCIPTPDLNSRVLYLFVLVGNLDSLMSQSGVCCVRGQWLAENPLVLASVSHFQNDYELFGATL